MQDNVVLRRGYVRSTYNYKTRKCTFPQKVRDREMKTKATHNPQDTEQYHQYLAAAITIRIQQLKATGGPTIEQAQAVTGHFDQAQDPGDRSKTRRTTEALAILSFIPGGIDAFGMHCQASAHPPITLHRSF